MGPATDRFLDKDKALVLSLCLIHWGCPALRAPEHEQMFAKKQENKTTTIYEIREHASTSGKQCRLKVM